MTGPRVSLLYLIGKRLGKTELRVALLFMAGVALASCSQKAEKTATRDTGPFKWEYAEPEALGVSGRQLDSLADSLIASGTKKLLIIKGDKIICERYADGWQDSIRPHYTASLAKALIGGMSLSAAMTDSLLHPDAPAYRFVPSWKGDRMKSKITIRHLATHTSGIEDAEVSAEEQKKLEAKGLSHHMDIPGWKGMFWRQQPDPFSVSRDSTDVLFTPGTQFQYSNPGIAMLTYAVTASLKPTAYRDVRTYLRERVYDKIGIPHNGYSIGYGKTFKVDSLDLVPSWGGGNFTAHAIARIGRLMLHKGNWQGVQVLDSAVVRKCTTWGGTGLPSEEQRHPRDPKTGRPLKVNPIPATTMGWYSNFDGIWQYLPRDAFCGAGAQNQVLLVVPSLDLIVVRMGENLFDESKGENFWGGAEERLFNPIMNAIDEPPYPMSELVGEVEFAPPSTVIRMAKGSDTWPATWGDDDRLYTAYGDGWGFDDVAREKLSLGLAVITGNPPDVTGDNIRTISGERVGDGAFGPKASGMLMVDGVLYMWVRNMDNARLARSADHGKTWTWAEWKFEDSFGCPNFVNYGKNYSGSQDNFVYVYSSDDNSAYKATDDMVLARVPKERIMDWRSYEFFAGTENNGTPRWSEDIRKRMPVFHNAGKCYRSAMTFDRGLDRYLWCQIIPYFKKGETRGPRFVGGLGIFESPSPWGPWKTVYYSREWDMGPGETGSLPPKWMSDDGRTMYYLFSGDDAFSVRKVTLKKAD